MKLSKIYANNPNFQSISFIDGLNVIYGDTDDTINLSTGKVQEHNLGKTSLVHLIDFLLLKELKTDDDFIKHKDKFLDWVFFLEIKLNNGKYLTIRRAIASNTKISFKEHFLGNQDFTNEENWNCLDLSLNSTNDNSNPKHIFRTKYLEFDIAKEFKFRNFLAYLLRKQGAYSEVFRLEKFNRGKDIYWKPLLFHLLGFNKKLLEEKYSLDDDIKENENFIKKSLKEKESEEIYQLKAAIEAKEVEKNEVAQKLNSFDFFEKEQSINFELVKNIETQISELNRREYALNYQIEQIQKSLDSSNKPSLKVEDIQTLFKEVEIFFPNDLTKTYQEVINFSEQITKEREKYLKEELIELQEKKDRVNLELKKLNSKRVSDLSMLQEKDTFIKYKKYQEDLVKLESEIFSYKQKLENAKALEKYQDEIDKNYEQVKKLANKIKEELDKETDNFGKIKKIFQEIYRKTFEYTALLIVEPNKNGNVEFKTDVLGQNQDSTAKDKGTTSKRILCASFVLAILINYSQNSFFRFAYHDGILEGWGDNHKIAFINLIREYCKEYNIQYIISLIKSEIPKSFDSVNSFFKENEIRRILGRKDTLFNIEF